MEERDPTAKPEPAAQRDRALEDEHASDPEVIEADPSADPDDPELKDLKGG